MFCDRARTVLPELWRLAPEELRAGLDHALNYVQWLPEELMAPIFDFLGFRHLLVASQVCMQWRRLAHDHVNFWRHIKLDRVDMRRILLATRRLDAGRGRPAILEIEHEGEDALVASCLTGTLAPYFCSLRELTVKVHSRYAETLWHALRDDTTRLRRLHIELDVGLPDPERREAHVTLPVSVLDSLSSTGLRQLVLANIVFPENDTIAALRNVEDLSLLYGELAVISFPSIVFRLFPNMQRLRLRGHSFSPEPLPYPIRRHLCALQYFEARMAGDRNLDLLDHLGLNAWMPQLGLTAVPEMLVLNPREDALYDTLNGLYSPFQLLLHAEPPLLMLSVRSLMNMRVRHFVQPTYDYANVSPRPSVLLENHLFTEEQVESLVISSATWALVHPYLSPFLMLTSLVLCLDDRQPGGRVPMPALPLVLPSLEVLTLESRVEFAVVDIEDLVGFKRHITGERRINLYAINVQFEGKRRALQKDFKLRRELPKAAYLRAPDFSY
ncbi:hypothetical protein AURDEDRAFT_125947 [Auricularia subglabra TFB-10046 SS5]|nr:hypothetical protein AURDEDRAFT_125947 [Auricularia subglabra TFB-10046 SS5]